MISWFHQAYALKFNLYRYTEDGGESCAHQVRSSRSLNNCPVCRQTLPEDEIRALSAEQSIAALPAFCEHCDETMNRGR